MSGDPVLLGAAIGLPQDDGQRTVFFVFGLEAGRVLLEVDAVRHHQGYDRPHPRRGDRYWLPPDQLTRLSVSHELVYDTPPGLRDPRRCYHHLVPGERPPTVAGCRHFEAAGW